MFVKAYQNMVFGTALRLLGNETEAEDVAQEVFVRAYDRFAELQASGTAGGWLKTVARNLCLNHLTRYRARWRFFSEFLNSGTEEDSAPVEWAAPETHERDIDAGDQRQLVEAALQKLPPGQRIPLVLYHFEDLSYEEIAAKLKISLSKVKTDIHRGRESLRRKLRWRLSGENEWGAPSGAPCLT
jgi:RNA polymerase sigma-70 factor (ECF subfamily)